MAPGLGDNAATLATGSPGVLHGTYTMLLQDADGQIQETHSVSAGLDYPGVGPEHALLREIGRVSYIMALDDDALDCVEECSTHEGILPAIESAHALVGARDWARRNPGKRDPGRTFRSWRQGHAHAAEDTAGKAGSEVMSTVTPAQRLSDAIRAARRERVAVVAFITAGFPSRDRFVADLTAVANEADVVEIGVPFTDPMADGVTIQRSSLAALAQGVNLKWILDSIATLPKVKAQLVLMGYFNPLLALWLRGTGGTRGTGGRQRLHRAGPAGGGECRIRAGACTARAGADPHGHTGDPRCAAGAAVRNRRRASSMR